MKACSLKPLPVAAALVLSGIVSACVQSTHSDSSSTELVGASESYPSYQYCHEAADYEFEYRVRCDYGIAHISRQSDAYLAAHYRAIPGDLQQIGYNCWLKITCTYDKTSEAPAEAVDRAAAPQCRDIGRANPWPQAASCPDTRSEEHYLELAFYPQDSAANRAACQQIGDSFQAERLAAGTCEFFSDRQYWSCCGR